MTAITFVNKLINFDDGENNMRRIEVIYDDGNNGLIKVDRKAKKNGKRLYDMSATEIMATGCGLFR